VTVEIFVSDVQSAVNDVFESFILQRLRSSFLWNCFSVARLSNVCIYILLFCCFDIWQWDGNGNKHGNKRGNTTGMGIRFKFGNRNVKDWELTAWKWQEIKM